MSDYKQTRDAARKVTTQYDKMLRDLDDDLVERLRDLGDHASFEPHMHHTAADRIEELEAHCKRLRLEAAHANDTADAAIERTRELEAKLAKVIAAYRIEAMRRDDYRHTAFNQHIVELKGQGDE